jgi:hypothetical protein
MIPPRYTNDIRIKRITVMRIADHIRNRHAGIAAHLKKTLKFSVHHSTLLIHHFLRSSDKGSICRVKSADETPSYETAHPCPDPLGEARDR